VAAVPPHMARKCGQRLTEPIIGCGRDYHVPETHPFLAAKCPDVPADTKHPFVSVCVIYRTRLVLSRNLTYVSPAHLACHGRQIPAYRRTPRPLQHGRVRIAGRPRAITAQPGKRRSGVRPASASASALLTTPASSGCAAARCIRAVILACTMGRVPRARVRGGVRCRRSRPAAHRRWDRTTGCDRSRVPAPVQSPCWSGFAVALSTMEPHSMNEDAPRTAFQSRLQGRLPTRSRRSARGVWRRGLCRPRRADGINDFTSHRVEAGVVPRRWPVLRSEVDHDPVQGFIPFMG